MILSQGCCRMLLGSGEDTFDDVAIHYVHVIRSSLKQ